MLLPFLLGLMIQFNERPHPSGKTFCQRHLVDWDESDPQTKAYLDGRENEPKDDDQ